MHWLVDWAHEIDSEHYVPTSVAKQLLYSVIHAWLVLITRC
jgi:hypothetical protein